MSDDEPISYLALAVGTPVFSSSASEIGTVEHVLQIPELDLFDGIVVQTAAGIRFVDRDQVDRITSTAVYCLLTDAQAADLPAPDGDAVFRANPLEGQGPSIRDRLGRMFGRPHWTREHD
jgi:hypothetical protein